VQVWPVSGPVAGHPGDADPAAAGAAHLHHGPGPAGRPGAALRRPQPLTCLVLEAERGTQVARRTFISAQPSPFPTGTASPRPRPGHPQVAGDFTDRVAAGEPPGGLQPQPLTALLLGGRVPAPLRIPHNPVIRPQPAAVTTCSLRVQAGYHSTFALLR